jgi:hypothetical protein
MIYLLFPHTQELSPRKPITLHTGEIEDYDFTDCSKHIYAILQMLQSCNLINECPYTSFEEVHHCVRMLVDDIDLGSDDVQISEYKYIRVEYRDDLLSLEVFVGV